LYYPALLDGTPNHDTPQQAVVFKYSFNISGVMIASRAKDKDTTLSARTQIIDNVGETKAKTI